MRASNAADPALAIEGAMREPARIDDASEHRAEELAMTEEQSALLRRLAQEAFEPEAFRRNLSRGEAQRRIAALQAKLRLQDGPPHVL